jgi:hypothetical protein
MKIIQNKTILPNGNNDPVDSIHFVGTNCAQYLVYHHQSCTIHPPTTTAIITFAHIKETIVQLLLLAQRSLSSPMLFLQDQFACAKSCFHTTCVSRIVPDTPPPNDLRALHPNDRLVPHRYCRIGSRVNQSCVSTNHLQVSNQQHATMSVSLHGSINTSSLCPCLCLVRPDATRMLELCPPID